MHPSNFLSVLAILLPLASARPADSLAPRFAGGSCAFHVTQHQKNEKGVGADYQFDLRIFDSLQAQIGGVNGLDIPGLQTRSVDSQLPNAIDITAGSIDADPITFSYAGQSFDTGSSQCSIGGYQNGNREGDCGFTC